MSEQIQGYRLSPQQKRIWLLQRDQCVYRAECAILVEGELNLPALHEAFDAVISRHEILRTLYRHLAGVKMPVQHIVEHCPVSWRHTTLPHDGDRNIDDGNWQLDNLHISETQCDIDLENGPIVRSLLITLSRERHVLVVTLPSLCADSWTIKNLVTEITRAYQDSTNYKDSRDEPVQYIQFSEWQNELLADEDSETGKEYWRSPEVSSFSALPFLFESSDHPRVQPSRGSIRLAINGSMLTTIEAFLRESGVTPSVLLMAAWQTLLWRMTGGTDIVVANEFDGRKIAKLDTALGLFSKSVPVRCRLAAGSTFAEILKEVSEAMNEAYTWQEYFVFGSDWGGGGEDGFEAGFRFEDWPSEQRGGDIRISLQKLNVQIEKYRIKLNCWRRERSLELTIESDHTVIEDDLKRLGDGFKVLLMDAVNRPQARIDHLEVLPEEEKHRLIYELNRTGRRFEEAGSLHELFERQAEREPNAAALEYDGTQLTYGELNRRANQLANYLKKLGVGPDVVAGICIERSPEMVIGVLGILKAGGAYLPIDPFSPPERLLFALEDSGALVVLTRQQMADKFSGAAVQIVFVDTDREAISRESEGGPLVGVFGDNLAYLIYTSGSTGQPKAVMITHNGVVNYLCWCRSAYLVEEGTGAPIQSPLTFDLTVTSLFSPLAEGKTIVLVREEEGIEGLSRTLLGSNNYSLVKITPAHLKLLSQTMEGENPEGLTRAMVIGGEALHEETLRYWRRHAPNTRLINEYGPTETVVGCCVYEVEQELSGTIPIGRPIANTEIYILDNHLRPVPVGVTGELYVGGAGVARGYLKRPDMTGEKFVPDPFSKREGARLYKTGDLGRLRADDHFEYIGRNDDQVKIRGYRIELEEVRTVLESAPGVDAAVVVARNDIADENRLVGYVTLKGEPSIQELRSYMRRKLPEYMIPSSYVTMKSFPLTQNGKVNRKALPEPSTARPELQQAYAEPRTEAELAIAGVWRQVLRLDAVGVNDNFFDLGGDSILMLHVFSQLRDKFEKDLTVLDLFQYPTIAALAKFGSQISSEPVTIPVSSDLADRKRRTSNRRARVMEARQKIS